MGHRYRSTAAVAALPPNSGSSSGTHPTSAPALVPWTAIRLELPACCCPTGQSAAAAGAGGGGVCAGLGPGGGGVQVQGGAGWQPRRAALALALMQVS